jgi:hypothetical protein
MYGGKHIAKGGTVFVFASENEGGRGMVTSAKAVAETRRRAASARVTITASNGEWSKYLNSPRIRNCDDGQLA